MTKLEKAKEYVAKKVARDGGDSWCRGDLINAWFAGYDTAHKEVFDDILEHNKDVLERLKNNVPPSTLTWQDIESIVMTADSILKDIDKKVLLEFGKENYYTQVLYQYLNRKQNAG